MRSLPRLILASCLALACSDPAPAGEDDGGTGPADGSSNPRPDAAVGAGADGGGAGPDASQGDPGSLHATQAEGRFLPDSAPWYQDVSQAAVAADSSAITSWMVQTAAPNGWGTGRMRVDFSIVAVKVPPGTARRPFQTVSGYYYRPDCDTAPVPVPSGGAVEETYGTPTQLGAPFSGYNCHAFSSGGDCHMLFVAPHEKRLYELYHATIDSQGAFRGGCLAVWDSSKVDPNGRGQQCTSADAAGFPIAPLLFTAEEIQAGSIDHAIRFILPNSMIRAKKYVAPATHGTNTTGPATSGAYGFRMRLKASYPVGNLSPAAQVVARALQKYGMLMSDGGNIALTAQSDLLGKVKWSQVGFDANSLSALKATDFEVIDTGPAVEVTFDCKRTQLTD